MGTEIKLLTVIVLLANVGFFLLGYLVGQRLTLKKVEYLLKNPDSPYKITKTIKGNKNDQT